MKNLSFSQLAIAGLLVSGLGYISFEFFSLIYAKNDSLQISIAISGLIYLVYLLCQLPKNTGKISSVAFYALASLSLLYLTLPSTLYAFSIIGCLWLSRCFFFHRSFIAIAGDASLTLLSSAVAYWTIIETSSLFLGFWIYFLIQALLPFLPQKVKPSLTENTMADDSKFESAYRNAEAAISRLNHSS